MKTFGSKTDYEQDRVHSEQTSTNKELVLTSRLQEYFGLASGISFSSSAVSMVQGEMMKWLKDHLMKCFTIARKVKVTMSSRKLFLQ